MDKALLVGINAYPGAPLAGCINDISDMAAWLERVRGFNPKQVRLLVDGRATTSAIRERLEWLTHGLRADDRILFHYSGHGAQVATRDRAGEVDGLDECICPVDFDWSDTHLLRDKDFQQIFAAVPEGVIADWVSDSCHSGDLERSLTPLGSGVPRRLAPPVDLAWRNRAAQGQPWRPLALSARAPDPHVALFAACQADQTAADATFNGRPNGALTYYLLRALDRHPDLPLTDLRAAVRRDLAANHYPQVPQLDGSVIELARPFLGHNP